MYNSCYLVSQIDTKKSPTLLYQKLHVYSLFTNIPCFPPKAKCSFIKNSPTKNCFNSICRKDLLQVVQKTSLCESYNAHSKKTCLTDSLQAQQLQHFCDLPRVTCTYPTPQTTHEYSNETLTTI